jgi:hypothetical protein
MIRYSLTCADGHGFDSWFRNAEGFAALQGAGELACPVCGTARIEKALMAPAVQPARAAAPGPAPGPAASDPSPQAGAPDLRRPQSAREATLAALRAQIEAQSDYVGLNFVTEARRMHEGLAPERPIHGEARPDEAMKLIEDGVPVAPLPFVPSRKVN